MKLSLQYQKHNVTELILDNDMIRTFKLLSFQGYGATTTPELKIYNKGIINSPAQKKDRSFGQAYNLNQRVLTLIIGRRIVDKTNKCEAAVHSGTKPAIWIKY